MFHVRSEQTIARLAKRGIKRQCQGEPCGLPFYDLNKQPIECPHCGTAFVPLPPVSARASSSRMRPYYKLEKPQPVIEENTAVGEIEADDVDAVEEVEADDDKAAIILDADLDADDDIPVPTREDGDSV